MTARPTGTVTFLFTDIEGSTRLWDQYPDHMRDALARHDRIVREAAAAHDGYVFSTAGDAFSVAFARPEQALEAALGAQKALAVQQSADHLPIIVRMAIHSGTASEREGDYFGTAPNRCARLLAVANGGQVLLTEATHGMVKDHPPAGASFRDLGSHRLRDLSVSEQVFALVHPDVASTQAIRSLSVLPNNLPVQLTTFVGRAQELEEAAKLLRESRLLTVAGVGGSGKTRLALQVASELLDEYPDGVWLCELAPVTEPEGVTRAVAAALAVTELPGRPLEMAIIEHLRYRELLLIFDNCEHLIESASRLGERMLASAPGLSILATSRELLGVPGEVPYQLRSMSLPDQSDLLSSVTGFDSIQLFAARGEAARSGFKVNDANAGAVVQVCRRLDGMPLAIELAAARLRVLAPEQIAARLDDRFRLLTGGSRTALPRQQTLQAAIDWSYDLLDTKERILFDRLSVFQGFTLEAAEAVCAADPIERDEVLDLVSHLVDKSLVATTEGHDGVRYRLLETLRQYGAEHLSQRVETDAVRLRHLAHYRHLADEAMPHLRGPDEETWLDRLEQDHDNLRQALRWAIDAGEAELGQSLAGILYRFWMIRFHVDEGRSWLDEVLAIMNGTESSRSRARLGAGTLAQIQSDLPSARRHLEEAVAGLRAVGDDMLLPAAVNNLGFVLADLGDLAQAAALFEEELSVANERNDLVSVAFGHMSIAGIELARGRIEQGVERYRAAVEAARASSSRDLLGGMLASSGLALLTVDELDPAERYIAELFEMGRQPTAPGRHLVLAGIMASRRGRVLEGLELMRTGIVNFRTLPGYQRITGYLRGVFDEWAGVAASQGEGERAATLLAAAEQLRQGASRMPHEQAAFDRRLDQVKRTTEPAAFEKAWQRGEAMSFDDLIDFVTT